MRWVPPPQNIERIAHCGGIEPMVTLTSAIASLQTMPQQEELMTTFASALFEVLVAVESISASAGGRDSSHGSSVGHRETETGKLSLSLGEAGAFFSFFFFTIHVFAPPPGGGRGPIRHGQPPVNKNVSSLLARSTMRGSSCRGAR
jgi:hypothetical protein